MNSKLLRTAYYEENYVLSEQEFKEFNMVPSDPYWKVRSLCYSLNLNCFGEKDILIKRTENTLFNNYLHKKPNSQKLLDICDTDIEILVKNLRCTTGKFDSISHKDLELYSSQGI